MGFHRLHDTLTYERLQHEVMGDIALGGSVLIASRIQCSTHS